MKLTHALSTSSFRLEGKPGNGTVGTKIEKRTVILLCVVLFFLKVTTATNSEEIEDTRRPIWNIAHMVNSIKQVDRYLNWGANSLEFDIKFDQQGKAYIVHHGVPCDCFRWCNYYENFTNYIKKLRDVTTPGSRYFRKELVLLFFDLKVSDMYDAIYTGAGEDLAKQLLDLYWQGGKSGAQAYVLISIPSVKQIEIARSFERTLQAADPTFYTNKIGFDFSGNEDLNAIQSAIQTAQISHNIWQGDGITNCLPRGTRRLLDALSRRDQPNNEYVDKVYWWTVDKKETMRRTLSLGVDGLITNQPYSLMEVLQETEFVNTFRLATIKDDPWKKLPKRTSALIAYYRNDAEEDDFEEEILYNS